MSSTGTDLKNSTTMPQNQRMGAIGESRPIPKTRPNTAARTMEIAAALKVPESPLTR